MASINLLCISRGKRNVNPCHVSACNQYLILRKCLYHLLTNCVGNPVCHVCDALEGLLEELYYQGKQPTWLRRCYVNALCVHPTVRGDCQVSTNIISSGQVQLTAMCTNPKCLSCSVSIRSIVLLNSCQLPRRRVSRFIYIYSRFATSQKLV